MTGTQVFALTVIITILLCATALLITAIIVGNRTPPARQAPPVLPQWQSGPEKPVSESAWLNGKDKRK